MTWIEVRELVSEIPTVSTTYNLKEFVGSFLIEKYRQGTDFEEFDNAEEQDKSDIEKLQVACEKVGIKGPKNIFRE